MSNFDEYQNPTHAVDFLASHLKNGTLVLFLGAGASRGFGLPGWMELVNSLRNEVGLDPISGSPNTDDLQLAADQVMVKIKKDNDKLSELISKHLYSKVNSLSMTDVFNNNLLVAISALLMGSKRGHVTRVVTLNYDNMLEWFLGLFGFVIKTVDELPALEGSEDVRIYHPHGFVPNPESGIHSSSTILLGSEVANKRLGNRNDPWFELTRHLLDTGMCLFIGMSGNSLTDRALEPLFTTCGADCVGKRPLGIWLLKDILTENLKLRFENNNIVPIQIEDPKEISEFLLKICEKAAKYLK